MSKRILVVDDEVVVLGAVGKALQKTDCTIDSVTSAEEALDLLRRTSYDLVITDLMMPGVDGLEFMLRARATGSSAQVIMLTGYPTIQTALKAKRLGAFDYVTKPFTKQELVSVVVRALRKGAMGSAEAGSPGTQKPAGDLYFLPEHSWARIEPDKTVRIGMARAFTSTVGGVTEFKLPKENDLLEQGRMCVVVRAEDGVEHHLHSPLSGRVIEVNQLVLRDPGLAVRDPEGTGWLLRLAANHLDRELYNLMLQ